MILRYFSDDRLAQASYLVGCSVTGEAMVIDPARDIQPYLDTAKREGLHITHVTETHIHADFVSGSRELAAETGAMIYLSDMGGPDWTYAFADKPNVVLLRHSDSFSVGNIRIDVLHTPGHTPEHLAFLLTDTANADRPMGIFTGDALFVGDIGRPDLLESVAGANGSTVIGARQQFSTVQLFKTLPDYVQVWPGHGAGSACGKALGAVPTSTLGYEKLFNPAFQFKAENPFVDWLLDGQPAPPRYFGVMKQVNKAGPALLKDVPTPPRIDREALLAAIRDGAFVVDLRRASEYVHSHLPGTISVSGSSNKMSTYVGSLYDYAEPFYLIGPSEAKIGEALLALRAIGIDAIAGYALEDVITDTEAVLPIINAHDLALWIVTEPVAIIDVRNPSERRTRFVEGSLHLPLAQLPFRMDEVPKDKPVAVYCSSGVRSQVTVSYLRAHGWKRVASVDDDEKHWSASLPTNTATTLSPVVVEG